MAGDGKDPLAEIIGGLVAESKAAADVASAQAAVEQVKKEKAGQLAQAISIEGKRLRKFFSLVRGAAMTLRDGGIDATPRSEPETVSVGGKALVHLGSIVLTRRTGRNLVTIEFRTACLLAEVSAAHSEDGSVIPSARIGAYGSREAGVSYVESLRLIEHAESDSEAAVGGALGKAIAWAKNGELFPVPPG